MYTFLMEKAMDPTPVLLPGQSHGQRSLVGCSPWGCEVSSSKALILQHSAFFTVHLSHPYITTGKTKALTKRTLIINTEINLILFKFVCTYMFLKNLTHSLVTLEWIEGEMRGFHYAFVVLVVNKKC